MWSFRPLTLSLLLKRWLRLSFSHSQLIFWLFKLLDTQKKCRRSWIGSKFAKVWWKRDGMGRKVRRNKGAAMQGKKAKTDLRSGRKLVWQTDRMTTKWTTQGVPKYYIYVDWRHDQAQCDELLIRSKKKGLKFYRYIKNLRNNCSRVLCCWKNRCATA